MKLNVKGKAEFFPLFPVRVMTPKKKKKSTSVHILPRSWSVLSWKSRKMSNILLQNPTAESNFANKQGLINLPRFVIQLHAWMSYCINSINTYFNRPHGCKLLKSTMLFPAFSGADSKCKFSPPLLLWVLCVCDGCFHCSFTDQNVEWHD